MLFLFFILKIFIILIYVLDYNWFLRLLLFFQCICCICYCTRFIKFIIWLYICMLSDCTWSYFLKLIPIIYNFITTSPSFFSIMENRLTWMMMTYSFNILLLSIIFKTTWSLASNLFCSWWLHYFINWFYIFLLLY